MNVDNYTEQEFLRMTRDRVNIRWTPYLLYQSFPKSSAAAKRKIAELKKEVFALQDIPRYSFRDADFERMINKVFIDGPIEKRMKHIAWLQKYVDLCTCKRGDDGAVHAERVARAKAVPLSTYLGETGRGGFVACPFHADKTPSMKIYDDNTCHCFSCGFGNDVIDLVMKLRGVSFIQAVRELTGV